MTESIATRSIETNVLLQKAYPVSFRILNDKMEEKIYLEDQPSSGVFEISNDSGRALHFVPAHHGAIAGPDNYHFALKFRPGILKSDVKSLIKHKIIQKDWTLSIGLVSLETGEVVTLPPTNTGTPAQITQHLEESTTVLYFLNTSKASLAPGEKILLPLKHLRLQADEGTQVTQVELSCKNLAKDPDYTQVLQPHIRHFNLTLINHRGSPIMPIHVGFTGFNAILNDGKSENQLTLRITNQQKRTPQSKGTFTFSHHKHSRMYLYFETDSEKSDYALGTVDQVAGIELEIALPQQMDDKEGNTAHLVHEPMFQGDTPIWEIYPEYGDVVLQPHQTKLDPNESSMLPDDSCMDIALKDIISDCYMGTTHLYLRLENIPGYWDHTYAIPIVKQPMVFVDKYDLKIGIPENDKSIKTAVNDALSRYAYPVIGVDTATSSILDIDIYKAKKLKFDLVNAGATVSIVISTEYVGIGTTEPTNKLSVEGSANFTGNVRIGVPNPNEKLEVDKYDVIVENIGSTNEEIKKVEEVFQRHKLSTSDYWKLYDGGIPPLKIKSNVTYSTAKLLIKDLKDAGAAVSLITREYVGIGTINPINKLSVEGSANFSGNVGIGVKDPSHGQEIQTVSGGLQFANRLTNPINVDNKGHSIGTLFSVEASTDHGKGALVYERTASYGRGKFHFLQNNLEDATNPTLSQSAFTIDINRKVGIGTTSPDEKLEVKGDIFCNGNNIWIRGKGDDSPIRLRLHHSNESAYIDWQTGDLNIRNNVSTKLLIKENGNVGIGNTNPGYPLEISGQGSTYPSRSRRYFNSGSDSFGTGTSSSGGVVLVANGSVISTAWFLAVSDIRVKNIINISESKSDLETLRKVEVTDYKYVDEEEFGDRIFKKVIAQQIQNIYPRAINKSKGTVPSVFELAEKVTTTSENTIIRTKKLHNFKTGDKVKLIEEGNGLLIEPITVVDEHTFSINKIIDSKIFVYGKEVDDLLSVDYDALSVLNISATQELAKQVEVLQAENQKLKAEQEEMKNDLSALKEIFLLKDGS